MADLAADRSCFFTGFFPGPVAFEAGLIHHLFFLEFSSLLGSLKGACFLGEILMAGLAILDYGLVQAMVEIHRPGFPT